MKTIPLNDLEMFQLLQAAYPDKFLGNDDETFEKALNFANELNGFEQLADLLGRVATLCMPMTSPLTGKAYHCLGKVTIADGRTSMLALVTREVAAWSIL